MPKGKFLVTKFEFGGVFGMNLDEDIVTGLRSLLIWNC
jgi:hypothetical protein